MSIFRARALRGQDENAQACHVVDAQLFVSGVQDDSQNVTEQGEGVHVSKPECR